MKLTEEIAIEHVVVQRLGYVPKKRAGNPPRRKRKKAPIDKSSRVGLELQAPLTLKLATLLGVGDLLYEYNREVPHGGYKRITLDTDKIQNVGIKVREGDDAAALEIQADTLEQFTVQEVKGSGPVLRFRLRTTGYISQLADFAAVIDDHEFTMICSPTQGQLFDKVTRQPARPTDQTASVYTV